MTEFSHYIVFFTLSTFQTKITKYAKKQNCDSQEKQKVN